VRLDLDTHIVSVVTRFTRSADLGWNIEEITIIDKKAGSTKVPIQNGWSPEPEVTVQPAQKGHGEIWRIRLISGDGGDTKTQQVSLDGTGQFRTDP
jgi:hypothetical protein